ncbi:septum formation initiator [Ureibacillus massiliensis 4400831 = CIP 108448 = CCUG 49529]|uniref:Septum formation initiator n=1 Tax=Ureibacillus massiliensis 4400831 = CIP 108448 = CCUG 49529 TaxID=1211035 RepID=A0A0A3JM60_9BACL|nr:septum formation initiator family protein [Ureibacillus massiliensis]KGR88102.1 septum formation initiator [Ureibacillus massiliensis 4400831 = CIP 108448 = CCUG 49529]BDH59939.1 cell division protein DIVIC [Lysinibacillus sp. PLM2]
MAKRHKQVQKQNTVRTLQNDYVRASDEEMKVSKKQKVLFRRRMLAFSVLAGVLLYFLISTIFTQDQRIAKKEQEKEEVLAELEKVKEQQEMLNLQIAKLEDDEYLAKLARKEYFLSEEGEIIFTIPNDEEE